MNRLAKRKLRSVRIRDVGLVPFLATENHSDGLNKSAFGTFNFSLRTGVTLISAPTTELKIALFLTADTDFGVLGTLRYIRLSALIATCFQAPFFIRRLGWSFPTFK